MNNNERQQHIIEYGPYADKPPTFYPLGFEKISNANDRKHILVVCEAVVHINLSNLPHPFLKEYGKSDNENIIKLVEIDNYSSSAYILTGYGLYDQPSLEEIVTAKHSCNNDILVSITWDSSRISNSTYKGSRLIGAVVAIIRSDNHHSAPLLPPLSSSLSSSSYHHRSEPSSSTSSLSYDSLSSLSLPYYPSSLSSSLPTFSSSSSSSSSSSLSSSLISNSQDKRYHKHLKQRSPSLSSSIQKSSDHHRRSSSSISPDLPILRSVQKDIATTKKGDVFKNRSLLARAIDFMMGISEKDIYDDNKND